MQALLNALPSDTLTKITAVWGAFLATILAVIKLIEFFSTLNKDRVKIRVVVKGDWKIVPPTTVYGDSTLIEIKAINTGQRPILLQKACLLRPFGKGGLAYFDPSSGPVRLEENAAHSFCADQECVEQQYHLKPSQWVAFVVDQTGRRFYSHGWYVRFCKLGRIH